MVSRGTISKEDLNLFHVSDDPVEVVDIIETSYKERNAIAEARRKGIPLEGIITL